MKSICAFSRFSVSPRWATACSQGSMDRLAPETQLLDYLYHCTASKGAELRGGTAAQSALCSAAQRSMHALEEAGLPAMALEALCMASAMCQGRKSPCHVHVPLSVGCSWCRLLRCWLWPGQRQDFLR